MEVIKSYQAMIIFITGIVLTVMSLLIKSKLSEAIGGKAAVADVAAVSGRMDGLEKRMLGVEVGLRHMPTSDDFRRIEIALADQRGDMRAMSEKVDGLHDMMEVQGKRIELIDDHLTRRA